MNTNFNTFCFQIQIPNEQVQTKSLSMAEKEVEAHIKGITISNTLLIVCDYIF